MVIGANYRTEVGVVGDLRLSLEAVNAALDARDAKSFGGAAAIADIKARKFARFNELPKAGRYFITNRAHGALGYAMSAALGAWFGRPESKVVAMMGDGSFGFTMGELETITCYNAPITYIAFSNAEYDWIKASQMAD